MWCSVGPLDVKSEVPSSRTKHSATLVGNNIYILGGKSGNMARRDFWKYNLVSGKWKQIKPSGERLPILQEHTAVFYHESIFIFGGEVSFSAGTETPLWIYNVKENSWRKLKTKKEDHSPKGRRGHTALVHKNLMIVYGGYQDLRGSCGDVWAFNFETESWHLLWSLPTKPSDNYPAPRHKHSAVIHDEALWIYGGMTDLNERSDLWRWDFQTKAWTSIKTKVNPGTLHSHSACKIPSWMIVFGGERNGQCTNDLWKFSFDMEYWEKITVPGQNPQPRSETIALVVSDLLLKSITTPKSAVETKAARIRVRTTNSADRGNRHSSYLPHNRIAPSEKTYVFQPTEMNYHDGSNLAEQYSDGPGPGNRQTFLQDIKNISQLNIRVGAKTGYTILTKAKNTESTESLLKQHASPRRETDPVLTDSENTSTPSRGLMVKSKSAYVMQKHSILSPTSDDEDFKTTFRKKRVEFDSTVKNIPRDNVSVPNFSSFNLPATVLTPVETTKLVYLDDEKIELALQSPVEENKTDPDKIKKDSTGTDKSLKIKRGESYSSHLAYADSTLEKSEENVSSTSDYCSIETVNRLSSNSSYSMKTNTPQEDCQKPTIGKHGPFGFCNPNYLDPSIKPILSKDEIKHAAKFLIEEPYSETNSEEILELQSFNGAFNGESKVIYRSSRCRRPINLALDKNNIVKTPRALSAGRVEVNKIEEHIECKKDSLYMYIIGGKEQGQVTIFNRPISMWKVKLV